MKNKGTGALIALAILGMAFAVFMIADDSEASAVSTEPTEDPDYTYLVGTYADSLPASGILGYCIAPSATATIAGDITLTSDLLISSGAELIINSGKTLTVSGPEVVNKGTITNNGTISLTGPTDTPEDVKGIMYTCLKNDAREIKEDFRGLASLESDPCAVIVNNGTISIGAASYIDNNDKIVNNGTISLSGDSKEAMAGFIINPRNTLKDEINESDVEVVVPETIRGVFENNGTVTVSAYGELINFGKILNKEGKTITVTGSDGIYGIISNGSYPSYSSEPEPEESIDAKSYLSESTALEYYSVIENYGSIKVNTLGGLENYDIILNYGTIDVAGGDDDEVGVIINHSSWNVRSLIADADPELDEVADLAGRGAFIDNFEGGKIIVSGCLMNYNLIVNHGIIDIVSEIDNNGGIANDIKTGKINGSIVCETLVEEEVPLERSTATTDPGDLLLIIPYYSVAYSGETRFVQTVKTGFNDDETTLTFITASAEKGDYYYDSDSDNDWYYIEEFSQVKGLYEDGGYVYDLLYVVNNPGTFSILDGDSWVTEPIVTKKYGAEPVIGGKLASGQPVSVIGYYSDEECTQKIDNIDDVNAGTAVYVKIGSEGNDQYAPFTDVKQVTIAKGDYDMSGVSFKDASKKYNRLPQHIEISGKLPVGADGSSPTVSYSGSAKTASDGPTRITATFSTTSQNYNAPRSMTAMLTIIGPDAPASPTYDDTGSSGSSSQSDSNDGGDKVDSVVVACIAAIAGAAAIIVAIVFFRAH